MIFLWCEAAVSKPFVPSSRAGQSRDISCERRRTLTARWVRAVEHVNAGWPESVTFPAGSSKIEPEVTPADSITLRWETFTDAANEAGISRRYGGIHFRAADLAGRLLGRIVAFHAWQKAKGYFDGSAASGTSDNLMAMHPDTTGNPLAATLHPAN